MNIYFQKEYARAVGGKVQPRPLVLRGRALPAQTPWSDMLQTSHYEAV